MYLRVSRLQFPVGKLDEAIRSFKETTVPAVKELKGFAGVSLQVTRETGECGAATFWETQEAMAAAEEAANRLRTQATSDIGGSVKEVLRFEQVIREMAGPPQPHVFSRVTIGSVPAGKLDSLVEQMRTVALPEVRKLRGFRVLGMGIDRNTNRFAINSIWDTAADREASQATVDELKKRIFEPNGVSDAQVILSEVELVEFTAAATAGAS